MSVSEPTPGPSDPKKLTQNPNKKLNMSTPDPTSGPSNRNAIKPTMARQFNQNAPESNAEQSNPKKLIIPENVSFLDSPRKKQKRVDMDSTSKMIAINVYKYIEKTTPFYPIKTEIVKTTAEITGVSVSTIKRYVREYKTTGKVLSPDRSKPKYEIVENLDDVTLFAISRKLNEFYLNNSSPTINKVLKAVNDDENLPSFSRSTMYKIMKKLNFK